MYLWLGTSFAMSQKPTPNSSPHLACAIRMRDRGLCWSLWSWFLKMQHCRSKLFRLVSGSISCSDDALENSCSNIKWCLLWFTSWHCCGLFNPGDTSLSSQWVGNRTGYHHSWVPQTLADTIWILLGNPDFQDEIAICASLVKSSLLVKLPICGW